MTETSRENPQDTFRRHLQLGSLQAAYNQLLAATCLRAEFDDTDPKWKIVSLRANDGRIPYQLRLAKWALRLYICEPALATWAPLEEALSGHFYPRFVEQRVEGEGSDPEGGDSDYGDEHRFDDQARLRIMKASDVADIIDFSRHTEYPLAD